MTAGTEVVTRQATDVTPEHPAEMASSLLAVIARAAADPGVDVDKMQRLLDMQLALMARAAEASFNQALARLKPQLPYINKSGMIVVVKSGVEVARIPYAKYEDIHREVMPLLAAEGFTVSYSSELIADAHRLRVTATFRHKDGHSDIGSVYLPLTDDSGAKNVVQGVGSILSYGKRYALCNYLDIVAEGQDDDGTQGAMQPISDDEHRQLVALIAEAQPDMKAFKAFMHVENTKDITRGDLKKATTALEQKIAQNKRPKPAKTEQPQ